MILTAFMLIFFIVFTIVIQNQIYNARLARSENVANQLFDVINNEAVLAHAVNPTYERVFYLPGLIDGSNYSVSFVPNEADVFIHFRGQTYLYFLDYNATFVSLQPGPNLIRN